MVTRTEAAWLAGFVDADGCIRLKKGMKNSTLGQNSLIPHVHIANTCIATLNRIYSLLESMGLSPKTVCKSRLEKTHARLGAIDVMGMKQCEPLLRLLEPHLFTKKLEAQILLQFIERRKTRGIRNKPYESMDYAAHAALSYIKKSRSLRDYMPEIGEIFDQDIVRTSAKALEVAEMTTRLSEQERKAITAKMVWYRKDRSQGASRPPK